MSAPKPLVVVGASAGALAALSVLLPRLPATFDPPIVVIVHMGPNDAGLLPELFAVKCQLRVKEAQGGEVIENRTVYFAPVDYHLLVEADGTFALSVDDPVNSSRPSIDVLFDSAADAHGGPLLAIVLTGANSDGAAGARRIEHRGGTVLVQSPESAHCSAMPDAALKACARAKAFPLEALADHVLSWSEEIGR